ncbi:MAG: VWA domain-containing protein [Treponema sp.]|nr:VWA domain-containing protein [Treponema sp.]
MFSKFKILLGIFIALSAPVFAQTANLTITPDDILIERSSGEIKGTTDKGYNLYIRRKPGMNSVMLVETLKDPEGKRDNYAFRAREYNKINGDEIRFLDGKKLDSKYAKYSLISSTPTMHQNLGECFLIYIPETMDWGYPWSRHGSTDIEEGTFINIRTFEKKYGDYTGRWQDNPLMFTYSDTLPDFPEEDDVEEEYIGLSDKYNQDTAQSFKEIAETTKGKAFYSKGPKSLSNEIKKLISRFKKHLYLDIVFAIDTTGSMNDDMEALQEMLVPALMEETKSFKSVRFALVCYRDYTDNYNYKGLPVKIFGFTSDAELFRQNLESIEIKGNEGGDVPEAVYEALYASMEYMDWRSEAKKCIMLIGDAEPHAKPKGTKNIGKEKIYSMANEKDVEIDCIIIPN